MNTRKFKKRNLQEKPAIVIGSFGSTRRGKAAYRILEELISSELWEYKVVWAYTSEIIREKTGHPGILEALAELEADGYRKIIVQPLHIFPGVEYQELVDTCLSFPGLRIVIGETLLHRWHFVEEVLNIVAPDFLSLEQGINIIVAHGTPLATDSANILYIGLEYLLSQRFDNVFLSTIEGIPQKSTTFRQLSLRLSKTSGLAGQQSIKVRFIPFMYVAGLHVEEDLIGESDSFKSELEEMGFEVDYLSVNYAGQLFPKGLGFYEEIPVCFLNRIQTALDLIKFY
jgi:sirohydrochlorin cobaltochelatase